MIGYVFFKNDLQVPDKHLAFVICQTLLCNAIIHNIGAFFNILDNYS